MVDPRSIYQDKDGFTMIQTATFANNFWMGEVGEGLDEEGSPKATPPPVRTPASASSSRSTRRPTRSAFVDTLSRRNIMRARGTMEEGTVARLR